MTIGRIITNDRQARDAVAYITQLDSILSSEQILSSLVEGLPEQAVAGVRKSLATERREISNILSAYEEAKGDNLEPLVPETEKRLEIGRFYSL